MRPKPLYKNSLAFVAAMLLILFGATSAFAQTSGFTYQGRLTDGGTVANGNYDLQFALWDSLSGGAQIGSTQTLNSVLVSAGIFSVTLDFGANSFNGANRFLEISSRLSGAGSFTLLTPRQPVTSTPYAVRSANAGKADALSVSCVSCVADTNISGVAGSKLTGTIPVNAVPAGSSSYIQNTSSTQSGNFNISGNGSAGGMLSGNLVNAATQYNLGGNRVLSSDAVNLNLFAGPGAGASSTGTANNSFFGVSAGQVTTGTQNSFFGAGAGIQNTTASFNAFFGDGSGASNTTGNQDSFFGSGSGTGNTAGGLNSFFGQASGESNTTGGQNSFFGQGAGESNTTGRKNSSLGESAGFNVKTGNENTFIGDAAGPANGASDGNDNSSLGYNTGVTAGVNNGTAIGANARVTQSDSVVLGSIKSVGFGTVNASVGIGTTAPTNTLDVNLGSSSASNPGITIQGKTSAAGDIGLRIKNTNGGSEWFIDSTGTGSGFGVGKLAFATTGNATATLLLNSTGTVSIPTLGLAATTPLCRNASNEVASCNLSSLRYKNQVATFFGGMNIISRLRPISFTWKQDGTRDVGFGAEEVEKVAPLFTFRNDKGEIEGVRYDRLGVVFVNAFKEQQAEIEQQQEQLKRQQEQIKRQEQQGRQERAAFAAQQRELDALKKLVCRSHRGASVCR